jgi:hypothetical protein
LDDSTAWLYLQYRKGVAFDVNALQVAIWAIEGEAGGSAWTNPSLTGYWDIYGAVAQGYIDVADAAVAGGFENNGEVAVVNPVYYREGVRMNGQSSLTLIPEPMTLIMLGFGLLGLGITSRKFK